MAKRNIFSFWEFIFSLVAAAGFLYWTGWGFANGRFVLPNPRPSIQLSPVRMHAEPIQFFLWAALLGGFGFYFLYLASRELRLFIKRPAATNDPASISNTYRGFSETICESDSITQQITVTDWDTGETRTYDHIDDVPSELRRHLGDLEA